MAGQSWGSGNPSCPPRLAALQHFWNAIGRQGAVYLAAEGLAKGGGYLIFVWLATLMSVADFGLLNVFISVLALLGVVVGFGIPDGLVRFYFRVEDFRPALAMGLLIPMSAGLVLVLTIAPWWQHAGTVLNIPTQLVPLALLGGLLIAFRQIGLSVLRARQEARRYFAARTVEPVLFLLGITAVVAGPLQLSYGWSAVVYVLATAGAAAVAIALVLWRIGLRWSTKPLRQLLAFSLPLMPHGFAMTGLALFDQVVLQQILGSDATGVYAYAYRFAMAMSLLVYALAVAWSPLVLRRTADRDTEALRRIAATATIILIVSAVVLAWAVPPLAAWLGGPRYDRALSLIPLIVYAYLWLGMYGLAVPYLYRQNRSVALAMVSGTAFAVNAVLNYLLIPVGGVPAAAVTTIISYILVAILVWRALGRDRTVLPFGRLMVRACCAAPLILSASVVYR